MVQINFAQKSVTVKIVYYGPGMSGKTTNLEIVHQRAPESNKGDLTSISTDGDRTLFFDFMPLDLGTVGGMRTQFQIYTVPGQVYYNSTRKLVLQGVDGVIFVADSSASMVEENLESLRNLEENLAEYGKNIDEIPLIIQYNKRDLPDALPVEQLEASLNRWGAPTYEAIANTGQGVFPTLKALAAKVLDTIHEQTGGASRAGSHARSAAAPAANAPRPAAAPPRAPMPAPMPALQPAPQPEFGSAPPAPAFSQAPVEPVFQAPPPVTPAPPLAPRPAPAARPSPAAPPAHAATPFAGAAAPQAQGHAAPAPVAPLSQTQHGLRMAEANQRLAPHAATPAPRPAPPRAMAPAAPAHAHVPTPQAAAPAFTPAPLPPANSGAARLRPRAAAAPAPASKSKSTIVTVVIVVVALIAGIAIGGSVFKLL
ncbi:MAG: GTPase domain-containing protein [Planctomycetota bacterium]